MKKTNDRWSIDEIILKLPLIDIKLKAPQKAQPPISEGVAAFEGAQGVKVALKAFNDLFVTAELNSNGKLVANRPSIAGWEVFKLFRLPDGKIALRAFNGKFVTAKLHEQSQLAADCPTVSGWEAFTLHRLADGKVALQAFNGMYVSADLNRNGELIASRPEVQGWEAFTLMLAD